MTVRWGSPLSVGVISKFDFGCGCGEELILIITKNRIKYDKRVYTRAKGVVEAISKESGETYHGKAFLDEFTYGLLF